MLPLLKNAQEKGEDARLMSVLAAAKGAIVDLNDQGLTEEWSFFPHWTLNDIVVKALLVFCPVSNDLVAHDYIFAGSS
jgi:hypothetical protein